MFSLKNKVAIVTGASRGIGKSIAQKISEAGAHTVCVSRTKDDLQKISNELNNVGHSASTFPCDVSNLNDFKKLVEDTVSKYEKIDILINNAGITQDNLIMRMPESEWDKVIEVNLKGVFNGIKSVSRQMMKQKYGRIINISSIVGLIGNAGQANYAASKAGLIGLSKSISKEVGSRNITSNVIAPGYIETDMTSFIDDKNKENIIEQLSIKRMGMPEDIANMVSFLCKDESEYITGQVLPIDGGLTT